MLIYEDNLKRSRAQQAASDAALRLTPFLRHTCLRLWRDDQGSDANDRQPACGRLAQEVTFVARLTSPARQAAAARAWAALSRCTATCWAKRHGKKGYPRFQ